MCFTNEARHAAARVVQQKYNPDAMEVIDAQHAGKGAVTGLRLGDPIVCTRNKYAASDTEEARALITDGRRCGSCCRRCGESAAERDAQTRRSKPSEDEDEEKDDEDDAENEDDGTAEKGKRDILLVANGNVGVLQMDETCFAPSTAPSRPMGTRWILR